MRELIEQRTLTTKTWDLGGGKFKKRFSGSPLHYMRDGQCHDIDLTDRMDRGHCLIDKAGYALRIDPEGMAYRYTSSAGKAVSIELTAINRNPIGKRKCTRDGNAYEWKGVSLDTDYQIVPSRKGVATYLVLHSENAPRQWEWTIDGATSLIRPIVGRDAKGRILELVTKQDAGKLAVKWTGHATTRRALRQKKADAWGTDIAYPVRIDPTVNEQIVNGSDNASSNDFYLFGTQFFTDYQTLRAGCSSSFALVHFYAGLRFITIAIPQGDSISSALITVRVTSVTGSPQVRVYGNDVDDAPVWSSSNLIKNITKTTALATITPTGTGYYSFGVTGIVQEIVDRAGWSSSNDMAFGFFDQIGFTFNYFSFAGLAHPTLDEAQLDIVYTTGGGGATGGYIGRRFTESLFRKSRFIRHR